MESVVKISVGLALMVIGVGYLYRPGVMLRVNAWGRHLFFNDSNLLHYRRRWGLLAFLAAILFLYSGMLNRPVEQQAVPVDLGAGYKAFYAGHYDEAAAVALARMKQDPSDTHADFLFRQSSPFILKKKVPR